MNELEPEDVMRALEQCANGESCIGCGWQGHADGCIDALMKDAITLLREKDAEIEKLENEIERLTHICRCYALRYGTVRDQSEKIAEIRGEVATEIAEKLKRRFPIISPSVIDGIAQEVSSCTKN